MALSVLGFEKPLAGIADPAKDAQGLRLDLLLRISRQSTGWVSAG
jgi:hypothetical protein